jgi:(S)-mandelate dehydrogenase
MPWKRRPFDGRDLARALNIADLREVARRRVPHFVFEYVEGGAEDEASLRWNRSALEALRLVPQTLVDTSGRHLRTEILGRPANAPLVIAPTGLNGMLHEDGDIGLAKAAAHLGIPFTLSTMSTTRLEDVAKQAGGRLWMQLYVMKNRAIAEDIMTRAAAAGYEALVLTTDANVFGSREWDRRSYSAPGKPTLRARLDALCHPGWLRSVLIGKGIPRFRNFEGFLPPGAASAVGGSTIIPKLFAATITWDDITWIRRFWPRKLLIKGVLNVTDAVRAADLGCDGIVLTNHGGRQWLPSRDRCLEGRRPRRECGHDRTRNALRTRRRWRARRATCPRVSDNRDGPGHGSARGQLGRGTRAKANSAWLTGATAPPGRPSRWRADCASGVPRSCRSTESRSRARAGRV